MPSMVLLVRTSYLAMYAAEAALEINNQWKKLQKMRMSEKYRKSNNSSDGSWTSVPTNGGNNLMISLLPYGVIVGREIIVSLFTHSSINVHPVRSWVHHIRLISLSVQFVCTVLQLLSCCSRILYTGIGCVWILVSED